MFKKLFTIFILISFMSSVHAGMEEAHNTSQSDDHATVSANSTTKVSTIVSVDCDDCRSDGCADHTEHCSHHCSGIHNIFTETIRISFSGPTEFETNKTWYFNNHYQTPSLDPSLKPPLHA